MMTTLKCVGFLLPALGLAGCISPTRYETTPVKIESAKGVVTCQLYTDNTTVWDRSIDRPHSMSVTEADNICKTEGNRRIKEKV